jgi:hypothetical protein
MPLRTTLGRSLPRRHTVAAVSVTLRAIVAYRSDRFPCFDGPQHTLRVGVLLPELGM